MIEHSFLLRTEVDILGLKVDVWVERSTVRQSRRTRDRPVTFHRFDTNSTFRLLPFHPINKNAVNSSKGTIEGQGNENLNAVRRKRAFAEGKLPKLK